MSVTGDASGEGELGVCLLQPKAHLHLGEHGARGAQMLLAAARCPAWR